MLQVEDEEEDIAVELGGMGGGSLPRERLSGRVILM